MIAVDDLGFGFPTFPQFVVMLREYERTPRPVRLKRSARRPASGVETYTAATFRQANPPQAPNEPTWQAALILMTKAEREQERAALTARIAELQSAGTVGHTESAEHAR